MGDFLGQELSVCQGALKFFLNNFLTEPYDFCHKTNTNKFYHDKRQQEQERKDKHSGVLERKNNEVTFKMTKKKGLDKNET